MSQDRTAPENKRAGSTLKALFQSAVAGAAWLITGDPFPPAESAGFVYEYARVKARAPFRR